MAPAFGFSAKDVDTLLRGGMLPEEIEEYFYCTEGREDVLVWYVLGFLITAAVMLLRRLSACRKMINLAAIANALSALLKGALLALELLGSYDAEK